MTYTQSVIACRMLVTHPDLPKTSKHQKALLPTSHLSTGSTDSWEEHKELGNGSLGGRCARGMCHTNPCARAACFPRATQRSKRAATSAESPPFFLGRGVCA